MTLLTNSFEGQSSGTTVTAANSGGTSGSAFDVVTGPPTSGTLAYDNTHAAHGVNACKVAIAATSGQNLCRWSTSMGTQGQVWYRLYVYFTANPAATFRLAGFATSGGTTCSLLLLTNLGQLQMTNAGGTTQFTTAAINTGSWSRIEGFVIGSATVGQVECKVFNSPNSTTPTDTKTSGAALNTTGSMGLYSYGVVVSTTNITAFWMDDLGLSSTGYIGPVPTAGGLLPASGII